MEARYMKIDINENIASLIADNDKLKEELIDIGFIGLDNPMMIKTMATKMSIKRGAKLLKISDVEKRLMDLGYGIYDSSNNKEVQERKELIKSYIKRVSDGEDLENVKRDFRANFEGVSSSEIMDAEESLLEEGMDKAEVRKLCDVHSALFHGMTRSEIMSQTFSNPILNYFNDENNQIKEVIGKAKAFLKGEICENPINSLEIISDHYKKKGDLIYPLLKNKYQVSGPSDVMWGVDGEITSDISKAIRDNNNDLLAKALNRADEMTYKEEHILFDLMEEKLVDKDYYHIYRDMWEYDETIRDRYSYPEADEYFESLNKSKEIAEGYIVFSKGKMRLDQLEPMLDTLDLEITYVDENDINAYYNNVKGHKIFKRPESSLGRDVYSCHPPQALAKVKMIINDFKEAKKDKVQIIRNIRGVDYAITYYAVRDKEGNYKGVLETVQDLSFYKDYLKKKI